MYVCMYNLEKMILRLPKWAQGKFAEYLKKIERDGSTMPTFRNIVDFLKERADVANHPFISKASENKETRKPSKMVRNEVRGELLF